MALKSIQLICCSQFRTAEVYIAEGHSGEPDQRLEGSALSFRIIWGVPILRNDPQYKSTPDQVIVVKFLRNEPRESAQSELAKSAAHTRLWRASPSRHWSNEPPPALPEVGKAKTQIPVTTAIENLRLLRQRKRPFRLCRTGCSIDESMPAPGFHRKYPQAAQVADWRQVPLPKTKPLPVLPFRLNRPIVHPSWLFPSVLEEFSRKTNYDASPFFVFFDIFNKKSQLYLLLLVYRCHTFDQRRNRRMPGLPAHQKARVQKYLRGQRTYRYDSTCPKSFTEQVNQ